MPLRVGLGRGWCGVLVGGSVEGMMRTRARKERTVPLDDPRIQPLFLFL